MPSLTPSPLPRLTCRRGSGCPAAAPPAPPPHTQATTPLAPTLVPLEIVPTSILIHNHCYPWSKEKARLVICTFRDRKETLVDVQQEDSVQLALASSCGSLKIFMASSEAKPALFFGTS
ncbi:hypothetical protein EJB05_41476, partial [Eragrostis curvula]